MQRKELERKEGFESIVPVNRSKSGHSRPNKNSPGCYVLFIYFGFDFQCQNRLYKLISEKIDLLHRIRTYRYIGIRVL